MTVWARCQWCGGHKGFDEDYLATAEYPYCSDECEKADKEESQTDYHLSFKPIFTLGSIKQWA